MTDQWPTYSKACQHDVQKLLARGGSLSAYRSNPQFPVGPAKGSWAWKLERLAEQKFKVKHAVACNSGTMALTAALIAAQVPGLEIITTAFTFSATPAAILRAGYTPVFADVLSNGCMDPESARRMISVDTAAIVPVDLFGQLCDYRALSWLGVPIIEDACQAVGARRQGKWAGTFGLAGAYSFNGAKNVPAGEAGMMVTSSEEIADRARRYLSHGENFGDFTVGLNGRLNELTACVARHGLSAVLHANQRRRQAFQTLGGPPIGLDHACYVYGVNVRPSLRANVARTFRALGWGVSEGYIQPPLHDYPAFQSFRTDRDLPMTRELSARSLLVFTKAPSSTI